MLLRAVIIDDEQNGVDALKILAERYIRDLRVISSTTIASEGIEMIEDYKPDIVFLDINMPEMTGFELLEKLDWKDFNLVFTTAHQEYALRALKNNAVDYLLKPVDHKELSLAVQRVKNKMSAAVVDNYRFNYQELLSELNANAKNKLIIHSKTGFESVDASDILYFEAVSNFTRICLANGGEILTTKTLKDFEGQLCGGRNFMRVHHSFIVNLHKIARYIKPVESIVMSNEQRIPLAKSRKIIFTGWLDL